MTNDIVEDKIYDRMEAFVNANSYISYSDVSASEFGKDMFYFFRKFNPLDEEGAYIDKHESHEFKMMPIIGVGIHAEWEKFSKKNYPNESAEEKIVMNFEGMRVGGTSDNIMEFDDKKYVFDLKTKQNLGYNSYYEKQYDPDDLKSVEKFNLYIWQLSLNRWLHFQKYGVTLEPIGYIGAMGYCLWKDKKTGRLPRPHNIIELPLKSLEEVEQRLIEIKKAKTEQPAVYCNSNICKYCDLICYSNKRLKYGDIEL